ncbi:hypothetical protein PsorP6_015291 [Peronosclerospora sorghi]|uniref:Uncharacterized protein n=1 Tax=Peronosclerospora sorghi TaxID=230839 RepID=A0ACC0VQN3_9STRA|nr:hypothetical protein PsorP6_015291 [Peronosclerospora sorghi]
MKYHENGLPKNWDGKDWDTYKRAMTNIFAEQDLLDTVEKKESDTKKENKVRMYIDMSVPPSNMSFRLGGDMNMHLAQMFNKKRELEHLEFKVHDIEMIDLMLKSLPHHSVFLSFKSVLKLGSDRTNLDPTDVRHRMLLAAQEVAEIQIQSGRGQATGGKGKAKGDDKGAKDSGNGGEAGARRCFKCKSTGHIKANCPKIKKPSAGEGSGGAITKETNAFRSGGHQFTHASGSGVAKVTDGGTINGQVNHQQPLGADAHVTGNRDYFVTLEEFAESYEVTASGVFPDVRGSVEGIGTVALVIEVDGKRVRFYVDWVLYLPEARYSLLSSGHVEYQGFEYEYEYDRPHRRSSAVEIDGGVDVDEDDDDEQDEDASINYGVDLNDPTVDNDDRAVDAGAQDTVTGVETNTDDGANNDSANAVNGSVDRDSHASEPSHDSPATAEEGYQVSTEEVNNSVLSGDDAGVASRDMPAVDSESGRDGEPHLHDS